MTGKQLNGKPFFTLSGQIYCEDDFLVSISLRWSQRYQKMWLDFAFFFIISYFLQFSGVHPSQEVCHSCGCSIDDFVSNYSFTHMHLGPCVWGHVRELMILDQVLQARGKSYHRSCFRCVVCRQELEGQAFAVDSHSRVYCVSDYHRWNHNNNGRSLLAHTQEKRKGKPCLKD